MNTITQLAQGANAPIMGPRATVAVTASGAQLDVSALLLDSNGKVRSDDDLVFFSHPQQDGVTLNGHTITADLARIPVAVRTVAVVASIDSEQPGATFTPATTPQVAVACDNRIAFTPLPLANGETVVVLVELYRRGEGWKVRAVGQGYANGLAGLATDFGVTVDDPGSAPAVAAHTAPPMPLAPPVPKVPLGKVMLNKAGAATINLAKEDPNVIVTASLEWNGGSQHRRARGADLDLYALFVPAGEVTARNKKQETMGVVYYRNMGVLDRPPFIRLHGDARTPGRETITIRRPDQQGYVLICAYSAVENGAGSFRSYGARAVVSDGRGSTVTAPLFGNRTFSYWVAIALVDFTVPGGMEIRHVERYSAAHREERPMLYTNGTFKMNAGPVEFKTR